MIDLICGLLILLGSVFAFIAALGVLRMPDLLLRMHAGTKAGTLAVGLILVAAAIEFATITSVTKAVLAIVFLFITIPIGAHMLGRAAYFIKVPLCKRTVIDEFEEHQKNKP
jgi:multicomponent Na+:H+ antiporter subunit G